MIHIIIMLYKMVKSFHKDLVEQAGILEGPIYLENYR